MSFASKELFDKLNITKPKRTYTVDTLSGSQTFKNQPVAQGLKIRGHRERSTFTLPDLYFAERLPDVAEETPTKEQVELLHGYESYAECFPPQDMEAPTLVLLGRSASKLLHGDALNHAIPTLYKTALGLTLVGEFCNSCLPTSSRSSSSTLVSNGKEATGKGSDYLIQDVLALLPEDDLPARSQEERHFETFVKDNLRINDEGFIECPLPIKDRTRPFRDNRKEVYARTRGSLEGLKKRPEALAECVAQMEKLITAGKVERVPDDELDRKDGKVNFIVIFPVTSKDKQRLVYDSSWAPGTGTESFNQRLMKGPDASNPLRSVFLRFRERAVAFTADITGMFLQFYVPPEDRDLLRFFFWPEKESAGPLVQYRAATHIFGNTPSPPICMNGMKESVNHVPTPPSDEVKDYIANGFYVDDLTSSEDTPGAAVKILQDTKSVLGHFNIDLQKITSNSSEVLSAFASTDLKNGQIDFQESPVQKALGISWDPVKDLLFIRTLPDQLNKPFTPRGVLSTINSIFDFVGLTAPVVLTGRLLQRTLIPSKSSSTGGDPPGWDEPLPEAQREAWNTFTTCLPALSNLTIPRGLVPEGFTPKMQEVHTFCDASEDALAVVAYLRSAAADGRVVVRFVKGLSRVSMKGAHTVPRLELSAATEAVKLTQELMHGFRRKPNKIFYYSDSKVVLAYLANGSSQFPTYVANRVEFILNRSALDQWNYVSTETNPADTGTRPATPSQLQASSWLTGPAFLQQQDISEHITGTAPHVPACNLPEFKAKSFLTPAREPSALFEETVQSARSWRMAHSVAKTVMRFCNLFHLVLRKRPLPSLEEFDLDARATEMLLRDAQLKHFPEIFTMGDKQPLSQGHPLSSLSPTVGNGVIRVGGRLERGPGSFFQRHPLVVPRGHLVASLLIRHFHGLSQHSGRHITSGLIAQGGFYLQKGSQAIKEFLRDCPLCRRLRGTLMHQKMADLPAERLEPTPPFDRVALDICGPWICTEGQTTRRHTSDRKAWVLLLTCLASRACHTEVLEGLDTNTFLLALRNFLALRGSASYFRSDRGTGFVGAHNQGDSTLDFDGLQTQMKLFGIQWSFQPAHASHFGGVVERKIGAFRRALEAALLPLGHRKLSLKEFRTFVTEATSIVNKTPLWAVSHDPNDIAPLSPQMLLTLKRDDAESSPPTEFTPRDLLAYGPRRWRIIGYLSDQFFKHWRIAYIQDLTAREKWPLEQRNLQVGDVVLLRQEKVDKRNDWPLARVVDVRTSGDGLVRSATVETARYDSVSQTIKKHRYIRPVTELLFLATAPCPDTADDQPLALPNTPETSSAIIPQSRCAFY